MTQLFGTFGVGHKSSCSASFPLKTSTRGIAPASLLLYTPRHARSSALTMLSKKRLAVPAINPAREGSARMSRRTPISSIQIVQCECKPPRWAHSTGAKYPLTVPNTPRRPGPPRRRLLLDLTSKPKTCLINEWQIRSNHFASAAGSRAANVLSHARSTRLLFTNRAVSFENPACMAKLQSPASSGFSVNHTLVTPFSAARPCTLIRVCLRE